MIARTSLALLALLTGAALGVACGSEFATSPDGAGTGGAGSSSTATSGGSSAGGDASSSATSSAVATSSTSSAPGGENCGNGLDDDGDSDTDCADADCEPSTRCAPIAPDGWEGPIAYWEGPAGAAVDCPGEWPTSIGAQHTGTLFADPASCTCTCGFGVGSSCPLLDTNTFSVSGCNVAVSAVPLSGAPGCHTLNGSVLPVLSVTGLAALGSGGACPPALTSDVSEPSWELDAKLCAGTESVGVGCDEGQVCVPRAPSPFGAPLCVYAAEEVKNCPAEYPVLHKTFGSFADDRDCTDCACGPPTVVCGGTTRLYTMAACGGNAAGTVLHDGSCQDFVGGLLLSSYDTTIDIDSSCTPSGGVPTGGVTPTIPLTVCCTAD